MLTLLTEYVLYWINKITFRKEKNYLVLTFIKNMPTYLIICEKYENDIDSQITLKTNQWL